MSTRTRKEQLQNHRLEFKINFFQDLFTIIEELTGDCPGVGLPKGFEIEKKYYDIFHKLQKEHNINEILLKDIEIIKNKDYFEYIEEVREKYNSYWKKIKKELEILLNQYKKNINFEWFVKKIKKVTKKDWETPSVIVYFTKGYKNSGTYDRILEVIRIGDHSSKKEYFSYTLFHELIHFHINKHMGLNLSEEDEEILCRAIFKIMFKDDKLGQKHWKENLSEKEIEKINKKSKLLINK